MLVREAFFSLYFGSIVSSHFSCKLFPFNLRCKMLALSKYLFFRTVSLLLKSVSIFFAEGTSEVINRSKRGSSTGRLMSFSCLYNCGEEVVSFCSGKTTSTSLLRLVFRALLSLLYRVIDDVTSSTFEVSRCSLVN